MSHTKPVARKRRHFRVRKKVRGNAARPRLAVFRSNKHIYAQVIDDVAGHDRRVGVHPGEGRGQGLRRHRRGGQGRR